MRLHVIFIAAIFSLFFIHNITIIGQDHDGYKSKPDTIRENVIYEYDTIYVAPDTLKLTDTIVHYRNQPKPLSLGAKRNLSFLNHFNILRNLSDRWSIGIGVNTFINGMFEKSNLVDSFSRSKTLSSNYEIHIGYEVHRFKYTFGLGYTSYHERLQLQNYKYRNSTVSSIDTYDSLLIKGNCIADNYYQYIQAFFNFGKKWGSGKTFFILNGYISGQLLVSYNALIPTIATTKLNALFIQKIDYRIGINPCIGYKLMRNFDLSFGPFCSFGVFATKKYAIGNQTMLGMTCRIQ